MYSLEIEQEVYKEFKKLGKKDPQQLKAIRKKIEQILNDPFQFKPLRHPLQGLWRVHVGSFVIIYEICLDGNTIKLIKYGHHDQAYL